MDDNNLQIRQELPSDFGAVFDLVTLAFQRDNESRVIERLRQREGFIPELSLVAILDNKIIGHILFTKISILGDCGNRYESLALAPLSVSPDYQNRGVGGHLVKFGLAKAAEFGYKSVIVLGHENYYPKFGFAPMQKWNIRCPFDAPTAAFMGIEVEPGALAQVACGIVEYPKEFDGV